MATGIIESMFDQPGDEVPSGDAGVALLAGTIDSLAGLGQDVNDATRIDRIALLEQVKSAAAAAQAVETAAFADSQRAAQVEAGVAAERASRGVAAQVALARKVSPFEASRYVGWSRILTRELPSTFAALRSGQTSEWRAMLVARETAWLSREHRAEVDADLAPRLPSLGNRRVEAAAKTAAYRLDPHGYVDRVRGAVKDRRVTLRPAPDVMSRLGALLPVAQGVACQTALGKHADTLISQGDSRGRGQIMADTLVERLTGQTSADDVSVEVCLVMTDHALLDGGDEPAHLVGHGPLPAPLARDLALALGDEDAAPRWIRRLYTDPGGERLIAMESRRRCFTPAQRRFITLRDQTCRTPWCDAPIRHVDHVTPHEQGGPTAVANGQGYCQACNHARQAPDWRAAAASNGGAGVRVVLTTPTGHRYRSRPPDPPHAARITRHREPATTSPVERIVLRLLRVSRPGSPARSAHIADPTSCRCGSRRAT
jgi:hypothetical protein